MVLFPQGSTFVHDVWFRLLQMCKRSKILKYSIGIIVYFIEEHYSYKYGIQINSNIDVGEGLYIVHGSGVFLNCARIGKNLTVYPNVMVGNAHAGIPRIGNDVTIYTGAVIAGNIVLGDGCVIGANSVVMCNCESGYFYAGIPARKIRKV